MPIPSPKNNEPEGKFIQRCMEDSTMKKEFPDQKQRTEVCVRQWSKTKENTMEDYKLDEEGRKIIAENVPIIINAEMHIAESNDDDGE